MLTVYVYVGLDGHYIAEYGSIRRPFRDVSVFREFIYRLVSSEESPRMVYDPRQEDVTHPIERFVTRSEV